MASLVAIILSIATHLHVGFDSSPCDMFIGSTVRRHVRVSELLCAGSEILWHASVERYSLVGIVYT
jgi:hypothetical protein